MTSNNNNKTLKKKKLSALKSWEGMKKKKNQKKGKISVKRSTFFMGSTDNVCPS